MLHRVIHSHFFGKSNEANSHEMGILEGTLINIFIRIQQLHTKNRTAEIKIVSLRVSGDTKISASASSLLLKPDMEQK